MSQFIPQKPNPYLERPKKVRKKAAAPKLTILPPDLDKVTEWVEQEIGKGRRAQKLAQTAFEHFERENWTADLNGRKFPITHYRRAIVAFIAYSKHKSRWSRFLRAINIFR